MKALLACLLLAFTTSLFAGQPAYLELEIGGELVEGESNASTIGGVDVSQMIQVNAFRHEIIRTTGANSVNHKGYTIVKSLDKVTPLLAKALAQNQMANATIRFFRLDSNSGDVENYLTYTLTNCQIIRVQPWMPNILDPAAANQPPMEEVTIAYQTIKIESGANSVQIDR